VGDGAAEAAVGLGVAGAEVPPPAPAGGLRVPRQRELVEAVALPREVRPRRRAAPHDVVDRADEPVGLLAARPEPVLLLHEPVALAVGGVVEPAGGVVDDDAG